MSRGTGTGVAQTLFVNQIPYGATQMDISSFFAEASGLSPDELLSSVRMLKKPGREGDKVFNGTCFVDMPDGEVLQLCSR